MHRNIWIKIAALSGIVILIWCMASVTGHAGSTRFNNLTPGDHTVELSVKDLKRQYSVHVPLNYDGKTPVPVVIMFHGGGGTARDTMKSTGWSDKADKENFLVVYPEGVPRDPTRRASFRANPQSWNDGSERAILGAAQAKIDDVGFIHTLMNDLTTRFNVNQRRIYATGFSNGASMVFRAGRELSTVLAAIAPVAGSDWLERPAVERPVSLLYITGMKDPLNPIEGGEVKLGERSAGTKPPMRDYIQRWVNMLGCATEPKTISNKDGIAGIVYWPCNENSEVNVYTIAEMGHVWPGGESSLPERIVGKSSNKIKANDVIWEFFKKHPRK